MAAEAAGVRRPSRAAVVLAALAVASCVFFGRGTWLLIVLLWAVAAWLLTVAVAVWRATRCVAPGLARRASEQLRFAAPVPAAAPAADRHAARVAARGKAALHHGL